MDANTVRTAVITGSSGAIGAALCRTFGAAGYRTIGMDVTGRGEGCDAFIEADLQQLCVDEAFRRQVADRLTQAAEGSALAVLINNAAVQILGDTADLSLEQWRRTLDVNLLAPFVLTQLLLPRLEAANGSVVNIASIHAVLTKPGFVAYATSKAALVGLTRSLAVDLGARIRVNAICPAAIDTPMLARGFEGNPGGFDALARMHPVGRIGTPEEVARLALFLASPDNPFVSGAIVGMDGAISSRLHDPA